MMETVEVILENTDQRIEVKQGTDLASLAKKYSSVTKYPVLGALVNNVENNLTYRIYRPKCIRFFDITSKSGYRIYTNSLRFMLYKAVRMTYPDARLQIRHSLLTGCYFTISGVDDPQIEVAQKVRNAMIDLQEKDFPFTSKTMLRSDALELLKDQNIPLTRELLESQNKLYVEIQFLDDTPHRLIGGLAPSTGCITCWDLRCFDKGYQLICPDKCNPTKLSFYQETPKLFSVFSEHHDWVELLNLSTINDLNQIVRHKNENHLIHIAEALHDKKYAKIAEAINERKDKVKVVLMAGPSSSGKTTSCRRLGVQLSVLGYDVQQLSLDDYFVDRSRTPKQPNGEYDFEALEAIDIELLNHDLMALFNGERVEIPTYDFIKGSPFYSGKTLQLSPNSILLVEGIHALNPRLTAQIPDELKFRVYISALTQIAIDDQNIIQTSDNRLLRRIVRDNNFRGYSAHNTLKRWDSVRQGEMKHIFPYQENADIMFNSALLYELGILRHFAEPLLKMVPENSIEYSEAQRLLKLLDLVEPINPKFIPPTSIMREFLGGSSFEY